MVKEPFFPPETTGIAHQVAFGADDAMARDDDGDIVLAIGGGSGANRLGIAETTGHFEIADGLTKGDGGELIPDTLLERGAFLVDGEIKDAALSLEILNQLFGALDDHGADRPLPTTALVFRVFEVIDKADLTDISIRTPDAQQAERGLVIRRSEGQRC